MEYMYKLQDTVDGRFAFVIAKDENEAYQLINNTTTIPCNIVGKKRLSELNHPVIILNQILPF